MNVVAQWACWLRSSAGKMNSAYEEPTEADAEWVDAVTLVHVSVWIDCLRTLGARSIQTEL